MSTPMIIPKKVASPALNQKAFPFTQADIPGNSIHPANGNFILQQRLESWETFQNLPMPKTSDEAWRRTDLRALKLNSLELKPRFNDHFNPPQILLNPLMGKKQTNQIVLIPGISTHHNVDQSLSETGVIFTDLKSAAAEHAQFLSQSFGQIVKPDDGKFAALASAMAEDGIVVYVPRGVHLKEPLHSVIWSPGKNLARFTHLIIWLEDDAELTFVHELSSPNQTNSQSFHAGNVEIYIGEASHLTFVEIQSLGNDVWNFTHERAQVNRNGRIDWIVGAMGSQLTKDFSDIDLIGQGAAVKMSGFYFPNKNQHLDFDTQQNHLAPYTTSDLLFKGALKDQSRSVWQGMIYVAPNAQKTDGYQANRNLLLSRKARADSIPGLEILANDVRCSHGATVGSLNQEEIFYLLSRGITYPDAERLLVEGFFEPLMERIPYEEIRRRFRSIISRKIR